MAIESKEELIRGKWYKFDKNKQKEFRLLDAYGDWDTLINVVSTIFRAIHNFKNPREKITEKFSDEEKNHAINYVIREDQKRTFPHEIKAAKKNQRELLAA